MANDLPIRTPLVDKAGMVSPSWVRWFASFVPWLPLAGVGSPEGAVQAPVGGLYVRLDGGANTTLYVKESYAAATPATGWVAK